MAEDNEINLMYIATLLAQLGCECTTVDNGQEAVELLRETPFDLVLMDCQMRWMASRRSGNPWKRKGRLPMGCGS